MEKILFIHSLIYFTYWVLKWKTRPPPALSLYHIYKIPYWCIFTFLFIPRSICSSLFISSFYLVVFYQAIFLFIHHHLLNQCRK